MTIKDLTQCDFLELVSEAENSERTIEKVFCCDLLSIAMSRAPSDCAWVTVMANINTLAVASLADASCIILAEGTDLDEMCRAKAKAQGICVFKTALPVFDAALKAHLLLDGGL